MKYIVFFILALSYFLFVIKGIIDTKYQKTQFQEFYKSLDDKTNKTVCSEVAYLHYLDNIIVIGVFNGLIALLPLKYCFDVVFRYHPLIIRGGPDKGISLLACIFWCALSPFVIVAATTTRSSECPFIDYSPIFQLTLPLVILYCVYAVLVIFFITYRHRGQQIWNIITHHDIPEPDYELRNYPIDRIVGKYSLVKKLYISEEVACPICYEELEEETKLIVFACGHYFHPRCIVTWLNQRNSCPMCLETFQRNVARDLNSNIYTFPFFFGREIEL
ncbi:MAG: uncharacterized protein Hyperionvirus11_27 [Hyperionvirus sp.]|uniref:RING-type domain-containing protein n=1 Tax=Hyperionvirus sp. TaxID=2487770 RepID=A0A3G5AAY4_9VIRU|nr:MAG: uncharacterized protein Hyperionvirus11_27 [Hyperionvirus sp.]